jgi:hypothetical protein
MAVLNAEPLDMSRSFLPEALAGVSVLRALDDIDRHRLEPIRACSYLHLFDLLEAALGDAARERARHDVDTRDVLAPLLRFDAFDHHELFHAFGSELTRAMPVAPRLVCASGALAAAFEHASPLALLVLALHFKLVTQQHYLACVRGDERLEPHFVRFLKQHWAVECGASAKQSAAIVDIQHALGRATPGRVAPALRDYRLLVFAIDDVLQQQAALDVATLEEMRREPLGEEARKSITAAEVAGHRKTFLTVGIVNAAFVYAMRSLGPTAPSMLAGVVSALAAR